ncbi:putative g-protein coupled receptor protein [Neofusicoccum parvum]|uniref:G-protein coupled receptor protein n=1 Tax=Neofusicoccum parvum TaxID=310453 RepID=A0ACB5SDC2_9PEZI|nr:putative g-protein coupled receptor protein [Neofusicoccum parvum]
MSDEARTYESVSRAASTLSIASTVFVVATFAAFPCFRKPINRLIIYASIGNVLLNVGSIISVSGTPARGASSDLCRFQGFFMQMFMPADAMWTLSMATNVYLTFFRKYDANDLRSLEMRYVAINYGVWFIPAAIYLILDMSPVHSHIYGDATIWCWISHDFEWVRFAFFYIPVWVVILVTIAIYVRTGREIFRQRASLRNGNCAGRSCSDPPVPLLQTGNPFTANIQKNCIQRVTEIEVITEDVSRDNDSMVIEQCKTDSQARSSFSSTRQLSPPQAVHVHGNPHCVYTGQQTSCNSCCNSAIWPFSNNKQTDQDINKFYATASISRGTPTELAEARFALLDRIESGGSSNQNNSDKLHTQYGVANDAAWSYAKVAFLMFIALFIVWIPATINRVYSAVNGGKADYGIAVFCAAIIPTQGFWNCMIYIATSWSQCCSALNDSPILMTTTHDNDKITGDGKRREETKLPVVQEA